MGRNFCVENNIVNIYRSIVFFLCFAIEKSSADLIPDFFFMRLIFFPFFQSCRIISISPVILNFMKMCFNVTLFHSFCWVLMGPFNLEI